MIIPVLRCWAGVRAATLTCKHYSVFLVLTLASAWGALAQSDATGTAGTRPPNVVLVVVDALRADRIDAVRNGMPVMPRTMELARRSWRFTNAMSQEAWTKPSVTTILTSLYPESHGVQYGARYLSDESLPARVTSLLPQTVPTMATYFRAMGYATVGVQTNPNLQQSLGFAKGFETYRFLKVAPGPFVTDEFVKTIPSLRQPFFAYLHYFDPHAPYLAPPPRDKIFGELPSLTVKDKNVLSDQSEYCQDVFRNAIGLRTERKFGTISETGREYLRNCYDVECRLVDDQLSALLKALRAMLGNTVIVFTADHGEEFYEHGSLGHGRTVYREVAQVPLFIWLPGQPPRRDDTPVGTIDILPTLAGYLGMKPDPQWQGVNRLQPPPDPVQTPEPQFLRAGGVYKGSRTVLSGVKVGPEKLIMEELTGAAHLYDLTMDPNEQQDLSAQFPERVTKLKAMLVAHQEKCRAVQIPAKEKNLDRDTAEAIESLGYLGK